MQRATLALLVIAFAGSALAFAPTSPVGLRSGAALSSVSKFARATRVAPKMSMAALPDVASQALLVSEGMGVSVAAYLAVLLGVFVPVVFLITLFIQSEARKSTTVDE